MNRPKSSASSPPSRRSRGVLPRAFYARPTLGVAADLIGKVLVHQAPEGQAAGVIVEAEAYIGESDPACHAAPGPTPRNQPLYGPPGVAYVYLNYGMHYLVNAVTEDEGHPAAVLIRALEPIEGVELMRERRGRTGAVADLAGLCRGPGNLTKALGISLAHNRLGLAVPPLSIEDWGVRVPALAWGPRIGIRVGADRPWRCWIPDHACVSASRTAPAPRVLHGRSRAAARR